MHLDQNRTVKSKRHKLSHLKFSRWKTARSVFKRILNSRFLINGLCCSNGFSFWPWIIDIATKVPTSHGFSTISAWAAWANEEHTSKSVIEKQIPGLSLGTNVLETLPVPAFILIFLRSTLTAPSFEKTQYADFAWRQTPHQIHHWKAAVDVSMLKSGTTWLVWLPKYVRTWTRRFIRTKVTSVKLGKRKLKTSKTDFHRAENTGLYMIEETNVNGK